MQGQLFTQDFLTRGVTETPPHQDLTDATFAAFRDALLSIDAHNVRVSVRNPGADATTATVQIYARRLGDRSGDDAFQRLVGFAHCKVGGGEEVTVDIQLDPRSYRSWSVDAHDWEHTTGPYELRIGWSSRDIVTRLVVDES